MNESWIPFYLDLQQFTWVMLTVRLLVSMNSVFSWFFSLFSCMNLIFLLSASRSFDTTFPTLVTDFHFQILYIYFFFAYALIISVKRQIWELNLTVACFDVKLTIIRWIYVLNKKKRRIPLDNQLKPNKMKKTNTYQLYVISYIGYDFTCIYLV